MIQSSFRMAVDGWSLKKALTVAVELSSMGI